MRPSCRHALSFLPLTVLYSCAPPLPVVDDNCQGSACAASTDTGYDDEISAADDVDGGPPEDAGSTTVETTTEQSACPAIPIDDDGVVDTHLGSIRGTSTDYGYRFLGIPYAAPPVGDLRFRKPRPAACFDDIYDADDYGSACIGYHRMAAVAGVGIAEGDEDCLTLNIWTPAVDDEKRPVIFFIHGGGNITGSADDDLIVSDVYDGQRLAGQQNVVVVTANYRLGPLGFFAHPQLAAEEGGSGNWGLHDIIAALRFVKTNIAAFGGDPDRVLAVGESSGASNVCALLTSSMDDTLISSAAIMSGVCFARSQPEAHSQGEHWSTQLGCASDTTNCLRNADVDDLMALYDPDVSPFITEPPPFFAAVDNDLLDAEPLQSIATGDFVDVPILVGSNAHEAEVLLQTSPASCLDYPLYLALHFDDDDEIRSHYSCWDYLLPRWAVVDILTDRAFTCSARRTARTLRDAGADVYRYLYDYTRKDPLFLPMRAGHSLELPLLFGTYSRPTYWPPNSEHDFATAFSSLFADVAAGTEPAFDGTPLSKYSSAEPTQILSTSTEVIWSLDDDKCDYWDQTGVIP